jgi:hypothetical protein
VNSAADEAGPVLSFAEPGPPTLYFSSTRSGGVGGSDIYMSQKAGDWTFGPSELVPSVNSAYDDMQPSLSRNGRELAFASNQISGAPPETPSPVPGPSLSISDRVSTVPGMKPGRHSHGMRSCCSSAPPAPASRVSPISTIPPGIDYLFCHTTPARPRTSGWAGASNASALITMEKPCRV